MCGIVAIFNDKDSKNKLMLSLKKIIHRGSSDFEYKKINNCSLGTNRLPIVDREKGKQPQENEKGSIYAIQNGEIFNHRKLRQELIEKKHKFKTESDTEVLVHLYEEYGVKMVQKLDSEMFAFIIYDKLNDNIFAARDPLGIKPLYYAKTDNGIIFASELKQLSNFNDIEKIYEFPKGTYYNKGRFKKYFDFKFSNSYKKEDEVIRMLEKKIVDAVSKRVDTDLPIGVLLSGGVDSSLIMEIAYRLHSDVTAIILGFPNSPDYNAAIKLCKERGYKYHVVKPDIDYEQELDNIIYHLETYEPLIVRQSFSLNICAREAQRLGLRVLLAGDGADELFAGYNEFSGLPSKLINKGCYMLTNSMSAGHFLRIDRMSMKHTVEIRTPFFDNDIVETAFNIDGKLKIKKKNHEVVTKYILRKVAENFLPSYIAWRYKIPFSNGAGMNVGNNYKAQDGEIARIVLRKKEATLPPSLIKKYSINTKEENYYLKKFHEFGFTKLKGSEKRLIVKDNLLDLYKTKKQRLLIGEFDRLAAFFPVYFASEKGIFDLHNLDVDYIATGGDDKTYASLVNNSAHIGLSDPLFAMFENKEGVKGKIIGELISKIINVAVTLNPNIKISNIEDFKKYKIGTFQNFSTTHTLTKYLLPKDTHIISLDHKELSKQLISRKIDIAIILPEQAYNLERLGGKIVYDFSQEIDSYLFSGFTISNLLEDRYKKHLKSFLVSVRESIRYILRNKNEALESFSKIFPDLNAPEKIFNKYLQVWSPNIKIDKQGYKNAKKVWKSNYPQLLKNYQPFFRTFSKADSVIKIINSRQYRKDYPFLEDLLQQRIVDSMEKNKPLRFFGFWGVSDKIKIADQEHATLKYFNQFIKNIGELLNQPIEVTWILADKHAQINGYSKRRYQKYLSEICFLFEQYNYNYVFLSELWKKWGVTKNFIEKELKEKKEYWWSDINVSSQLEEQARDHCKSSNNIEGAKKYYIMRMFEKKYLKKEFSDYIFFVYGDGRMQSILPDLPTIYLYTTSRGSSESPWFS